MLDMGFEKDVRSIIGLTPPSRRTAMFTATWPEAVRELAAEFMTEPVRVNIGSDELAANHRVTQVVEVIDQQQKEGRLFELLNKYHADRKNRVLIFALYKKEAARVEQTLQRRGCAPAPPRTTSPPPRTAPASRFRRRRPPPSPTPHPPYIPRLALPAQLPVRHSPPGAGLASSPSTATSRSRSARATCSRSRTAACRSSWRPTWRRAASTSLAWRS